MFTSMLKSVFTCKFKSRIIGMFISIFRFILANILYEHIKQINAIGLLRNIYVYTYDYN